MNSEFQTLDKKIDALGVKIDCLMDMSSRNDERLKRNEQDVSELRIKIERIENNENTNLREYKKWSLGIAGAIITAVLVASISLTFGLG